MKELSIEQKVRACNKALERARKLHEAARANECSEYARDFEEIFPELNESEDEQSKKWILEYLYDGLRKSDEQFKDQFKAAIAWLEKQGEQIPTDKVEQKFKVGDWIIGNNYDFVLCVENYNEYDGYQVKAQDDIKYHLTKDIEKVYHLWTIHDAKDGDVLTTGNFIFIFKRIVLPNDPMVVYYCAYEIYQDEETVGNGFYKAAENSRMGHLDSTTYYPATKEQCDLLFQKMEEAGYSWDAEKKKLKKIKRFEETLNNPIYKQLKNKKHYESN